MIEGIEAVYQQIADAVVKQLPEEWMTSKVEAIFYSDSSEFFGECTLDSGKIVHFEINSRIACALKELRRMFKESGKPLWGQVMFELTSDGKFKIEWGYDRCDENGCTVWDEHEWQSRQDARRKRLYEGL